MPRDSFSGHLDMLLLAALQSRPMHGYAIIEYVRSASSGQFDYAEGTIYPALRRLEDDGLVRSRWSGAEGRRRRTYEISAQGTGALARQRREWKRFTEGVEAVLGHG
jgi:DNA-binding PadR family transcriptional regulator